MMDGMFGSMMDKSADFTLRLKSVDNGYMQSLLILIQDEGNTKFFVKTKNIKTDEVISNYNSDISFYRNLFLKSNKIETSNQTVMENVNFKKIQLGEQYIAIPTLLKSNYSIKIRINSIDGNKLNSPLSFNYKFNYEATKNNSDNFLGVNYWIWGGVMGVIMTVFMITGH